MKLVVKVSIKVAINWPTNSGLNRCRQRPSKKMDLNIQWHELKWPLIGQMGEESRFSAVTMPQVEFLPFLAWSPILLTQIKFQVVKILAILLEKKSIFSQFWLFSIHFCLFQNYFIWWSQSKNLFQIDSHSLLHNFKWNFDEF